ncbi:hypothetical protein UlMin_024467 [Ulmus minor]
MKQVVFKLGLHDEKCKKKVMKVASGHSGVDSISMDMKDKKLTVTGDIDPVSLVSKLRKLCETDILSVGPPKAAEKKEEPKEAKKDPKDNLAELLKQYPAYHPQAYYQPYPQPISHYYVTSVDEDPNACVIC